MKLIICQTYIVDSSFHKQSPKIDNYVEITELIDSLIGQSTVIQELEEKRPKLSKSDLNQHKIEEGTLIFKMVLILLVV